MTGWVDLNADLGEGFGAYRIGHDEDLMRLVTSANIACGFHAGDPQVMARTIDAALACDVRIGAHPGYPDLQGFGRRQMSLSPLEIRNIILYQVGALQALVAAAGGSVKHVKLHGALYHTVAYDVGRAHMFVEAVRQLDANLIIYAPALSPLVSVARGRGQPVFAEAFADRQYEADGTLTPRSDSDGTLHEVGLIATRLVKALSTGYMMTKTGENIRLPIDTICVHGDHEDAVATAKRVREAIQCAGFHAGVSE